MSNRLGAVYTSAAPRFSPNFSTRHLRRRELRLWPRCSPFSTLTRSDGDSEETRNSLATELPRNPTSYHWQYPSVQTRTNSRSSLKDLNARTTHGPHGPTFPSSRATAARVSHSSLGRSWSAPTSWLMSISAAMGRWGSSVIEYGSAPATYDLVPPPTANGQRVRWATNDCSNAWHERLWRPPCGCWKLRLRTYALFSRS